MSASGALLEIRNLVVRFGDFTALNGVDLTLKKGEIRVLLGPNGAGKSTLMDAICAKSRASEGSIKFNNTEISHLEEADIANLGISRKFQAPTVLRSLTVLENLEIAHRRQYGVLTNLFCRLNPLLMRSDAQEVLEQLGLEDKADTLASDLSHGESQWLELGMAMLQDPELLLLDEPTAGMTIAETLKTSELIQRIRGDRAIMIVEHDMAFVRDISETITVLHQGRVLAEGTAEEIDQNVKVKEVYLGKSGVTDA